ncbi:hypothetical protein Tco_0098718 [Tanacetum coccineum]
MFAGTASAVYQRHRLANSRAPNNSNQIRVLTCKILRNLERSSQIYLGFAARRYVLHDVIGLRSKKSHLCGKEVSGGRFKSGVGDGRYEGMKGGISGMVREVKKVSMGGVGGGALAMHLIDLRVGFGGEGLVVDGGRSPNISRKEGDVGRVAKVSSTGSKEIATREVILEG